MKQLQNKQVPLEKVLWQHHGREEATWEPEATMRAQYPQLFESGMNFEDEILFKGGGGGGGGGRGGGGGGGGGGSCNTPNYTLTVL